MLAAAVRRGAPPRHALRVAAGQTTWRAQLGCVHSSHAKGAAGRGAQCRGLASKPNDAEPPAAPAGWQIPMPKKMRGIVDHIKDRKAQGDTRGYGGLLSEARTVTTERMQETHSIEIFQQQVETISSMQHFTLQDLLDQIKEGLEVHMGVTPLKENLPWYKNNPQILEMKENIQLLQALTPAERREPRASVGPLERQRVANACPDVEEGEQRLTELMKQYQNAVFFHKWLLKRKKANQPMPRTQREANEIMVKEQSSTRAQGQTRSRMKRAAKRSQGRRGR